MPGGPMMISIATLLRPAMKIKAHGIHTSGLIPRPTDQGPIKTPGPFPDQILLLGNGALAGWGVTNQNDAIPGHLARELTTRTQHPAEVHLRMDHTITCETATSLTQGFDLTEYDAIVVVVGASDALQLLSPSRWDTAVQQLLRDLTEHTPGPADIVLVGIQPPSTVPVFRLPHGGLVDQRAIEFNALTRTHCSGRIHFLTPPPLRRVGPTGPHYRRTSDHERVSAGYRAWATTIAECLTELRGTNIARSN